MLLGCSTLRSYLFLAYRILDFVSPFFFDNTISEILCIDKELDSLAGDCRCDIIFYKEHGDFLKNNVKVTSFSIYLFCFRQFKHLYHYRFFLGS